jgi:glycosyltransferase involved in cell wall biosynthesis
MKILVLVPFLPNTAMSGGQTRWYNIIKYLSKNHEITLYSLVKDDSEKKFIPQLEKYCKKVRVYKRSKSPWTIRNLFLTAFTFYPLLVVRNWSLKEKKDLKKELEEGNYDLIHAETFYVMPHIPKVTVPSILVEQTIEYLVYKHHVDHKVFFLLKPLFLVDVLKLRFWETYFWKKTNRLVAVSKTDRDKMQKLIPKVKVDVIPNGVDFNHFSKKNMDKHDPPRILFVGNFKWLQNVEAVNILVNEIWPEIKKYTPKVELWIVGKSIPQNVVAASGKDNRIVITEGIVDIRDAYKAATLMLVPIYGPGGTRLKVLEAMASALPVVSTRIGVEGLEITPGKHALVADKNKDLVSEAIRILKNKNLAERIGREGQKFVKENYDWESIVKLHDNIYKSVMDEYEKNVES